MKQPNPSDFDVNVLDGGVTVTFNPTGSRYTFKRLADGSIDPDPIVRHGATRDTGDYWSDRILAMARSIASAMRRG
jgi:hypothetical protein